MNNSTTTPIGSQIIPGDFFSFDMDINHEDENIYDIEGLRALYGRRNTGGFSIKEAADSLSKIWKSIGDNGFVIHQPADWPADGPAYHSVAGWALQKEMAYDKLRREMVNRNCANWFLYRFDMTGEPRYMIVADRLMEIERGE